MGFNPSAQVGFYYEVRSEPEMISRKLWTRQWWAQANDNYELVTGVAVLNELNQGDFPNKEQAIKLITDLPRLRLEPEILQIGQTYIAHKLMPADRAEMPCIWPLRPTINVISC